MMPILACLISGALSCGLLQLLDSPRLAQSPGAPAAHASSRSGPTAPGRPTGRRPGRVNNGHSPVRLTASQTSPQLSH